MIEDLFSTATFAFREEMVKYSFYQNKYTALGYPNLEKLLSFIILLFHFLVIKRNLFSINNSKGRRKHE